MCSDYNTERSLLTIPIIIIIRTSIDTMVNQILVDAEITRPDTAQR